MKIQVSQDTFINSTNISEHLLPSRRSSRRLRYLSEQITNTALVELTFTFHVRLRKWQVSTSKNRSILCGVMEMMGEPRAVLDTATHACYFPVTVLKAV